MSFSMAAKESMFFNISRFFGDYAEDDEAVAACIKDYALWGEKSLVDHGLVVKNRF